MIHMHLDSRFCKTGDQHQNEGYHMKAIIIGGGIIGLCSAYYLQKSGWQVTVLEKNDLTDNCSFGNAGMIVPSHFTPLASPGIISQGIRWMFDSTSPFYVKPELSRSLIGWGIRFIRKANKKNVEYAAPFLRDLNLLSHSLYKELATVPGFRFCAGRKRDPDVFQIGKDQG